MTLAAASELLIAALVGVLSELPQFPIRLNSCSRTCKNLETFGRGGSLTHRNK